MTRAIILDETPQGYRCQCICGCIQVSKESYTCTCGVPQDMETMLLMRTWAQDGGCIGIAKGEEGSKEWIRKVEL